MVTEIPIGHTGRDFSLSKGQYIPREAASISEKLHPSARIRIHQREIRVYPRESALLKIPAICATLPHAAICGHSNPLRDE
ncbi:MAG TPA: hypothetical protein VGA55_02905, partial [Bacteroidota bacterium]